MSIRFPLSTDQLTQLVDDYELEEMYCDVDKVFDDVKVLEAGGGSPTTQAIVKIKPTETNNVLRSYAVQLQRKRQQPNVFLKFMPINGDTLNKPTVEIAIYKYLYHVLVEKQITPHIMKYVASAHCQTLKDHLRWLPDIKKEVKRWYANDEDADGLYYSEIRDTVMKSGKLLVMELGQGMKFSELLKTKILSENDLKTILFQVGYTLRQMHLAGVRHNDIHTQNVWINVLPSPQITYYQLFDGRFARVESIYDVKIYDFDQSAFTSGVLHNEYSTRSDGTCKNYGMCEIPDPIYDWLIMTNSLKIHSERNFNHATIIATATTRAAVINLAATNMAAVAKITSKVVIDPMLLIPASGSHPYYYFDGRYCKKIPKKVGGKNKICDANATVPPGLIRSFEELWKDDYFDNVLVTDDALIERLSEGHPDMYRDFTLIW